MLNSKDLRKTPIVLVHWFDARVNTGWIDPEELHPVETFTVGYLTFQDKKRIVIASTVNELGHVNCAVVIPKPWVKIIKILKK